MSHTPGKLALEEVSSDSGHIKHLCPVDSEGMSLLTVVEHEGVKFAAVYSDDDARRLVACWNACELMPTEDIERLADIGEGVMRLSVLADDNRAQRDALMHAIHTALPFVEDAENRDEYRKGYVAASLKSIRAAIKHAEGTTP